MRPTIIIILLTVCVSFRLLGATSESNFQQNIDFFKEGTILRVAVQETGVYKITGEWLTQVTELGNVRLSDIQIYGLFDGALSHDHNFDETERLQQLPLYISNDDTPSFDNQDYILFYAEGADSRYFDAETGLFQLAKNPYAEQNFVFIKIASQQNVLEIKPENILVADGEVSPEYLYSEFLHIDKVNLLDNFESTQGSGQKWFGDELTNLPSYNIGDQLSLPQGGLTDARLIAEFAGRSSRRETIQISYGGAAYSEEFSPVNTGDIEALYARTTSIDITIDQLLPVDEIGVTFSKSTSDARLWLDFVQVQGMAKAEVSDEPIFLNNLAILNDDSFTNLSVQSSRDLIVWDISDPYNISSKLINNVGETHTLSAPTTEVKEYFAFSEDQTLVPTSVEMVENFDIIDNANVDMIILSTNITRGAAEKLLVHRRAQNISSIIVDPQKIYDLYSAGKQDPTAIRNYVRELYNTYSRFSFLLLLGDASFDYRYINTQHPRTNLIPTFETFNSTDPLLAFPSDDYYALLDDDENGVLRGDLDINVGRLTVRNEAEANAVIDKIISYDQKTDEVGRWKTHITFLADDEDNNLHINDADRIANEVASNYPLLNQDKIYFDAFRQESTPGGNRYPLATDRLNTTAERGALIINYLGHGGPNGWGQERVLKIDDINGWTNVDRLPLIITATCSFTGFDDPAITSAGEAALLNPTGGALSLFTTVRSVFASKNFQLTRSVFRQIFEQENGQYLHIGEIMRRAKNSNPNDNTNARKFFLIGDPSIRLSLPELSIQTNKINGLEVSEDGPSQQLSALDNVVLEASVHGFDGRVLTNYNGEVEVVVYDKATQAQTIANDERSFIKSFETQQNIIYQGKAKVINGLIQTSFTIPIDIDYQIGAAKITYYSLSNDLIEAAGYSNDLMVGGTAQKPVIDDQPPLINAYLNDRNFANGDEVPTANLVIVDISDDFGINLSSTGIGHEITAILDDDSQTTMFLNEFLTSSSDDPRGGVILFNVENLSIGPHTLTIKAFDVANNFSEETINFIVSEEIGRKITKIVNGPSPIRDETRFQIYHNMIDREINITMNVYDIQGRLMESIKVPNIPKDGISDLTWAPMTIYQGTFVCYFTLESTTSGESDISMAKKVILLK